MVWNKLDECIGAGILGGIAILAILVHGDGTVVGACVAGIVALLTQQAARKREPQEPEPPIPKP